jgi:hypothetical protein
LKLFGKKLFDIYQEITQEEYMRIAIENFNKALKNALTFEGMGV